MRALRAPSQRRMQVSTNGGREPLWARNGRELFYLAPDGTLMGVPIEAGTGEPTFLTPGAVIGAGGIFDCHEGISGFEVSFQSTGANRPASTMGARHVFLACSMPRRTRRSRGGRHQRR